MIRGTKRWDDRGTFSVQTNNAVETILSKKLQKDSRGVPVGWLEDCGPTAAVNVLESMGVATMVKTPGGWIAQPEDALAMWFNDPRNYSEMKKARADIDPGQYLGNEVPQFYPSAVKAVFGVVGMYTEGQSFEWIGSLVSSGVGAMICLKNPGHYLAVVAYDDVKKELIYRDSWPGRTGTDGFNLRMSPSEFKSNVKPFVIVFK